MKRLVALILITLSATAIAQHHHRHGGHQAHRCRAGAARTRAGRDRGADRRSDRSQAGHRGRRARDGSGSLSGAQGYLS